MLSLIRTVFVKHNISIFYLVRTAFLLIYKNIVRLLPWYIKYEKCKALKKKISE